MKKLFTNSVYILVLACCGLLTMNACGDDNPNPEPDDNGGNGDGGGLSDSSVISECYVEDCTTCHGSRKCPHGYVCKGTCQKDEGLSVCGDYICEGNETCFSCPNDCGAAGPCKVLLYKICDCMTDRQEKDACYTDVKYSTFSACMDTYCNKYKDTCNCDNYKTEDAAKWCGSAVDPCCGGTAMCASDQYCKDDKTCVFNPFPSVVGKWTLTYKYTEGESIITLQLTQSGDIISGYDDNYCPYSGTITEDGSLSLAGGLLGACPKVQITLTGKLINPSRMEGTWTDTVSNTGTWWADKK